MASDDRRHIFDNPRNVKLVIYGLCAICALSLIAELFVDRHAEYPWESWFGFYAVYGFAACTLLVVIAKELRKILRRDEDYYDR